MPPQHTVTEVDTDGSTDVVEYWVVSTLTVTAMWGYSRAAGANVRRARMSYVCNRLEEVKDTYRARAYLYEGQDG